jgi:EAL domain-containing protein (putative c-di-GMP-specific phosphodiesterase class I)
MNDELIKHKRNLLNIYNKNLQQLEIRQADGSFDLSLINQIENIKNMVLQLEEDLTNLSSTSTPSNFYSVRIIPYPLQKYEDIISRFSEELSGWNGDASRYKKSVLIALKRAIGAKFVFTTQYVDGNWQILTDYGDNATEVTNLLMQPGSLREVLLQSQEKTDLILVFIDNPLKISLLLPISKGNNPEILVFYEIKDGFEYDKGLELILQTIVKSTDGFRLPFIAEQLELRIYNALKNSFGYVSDSMYSRQFYLFNRKLESMTIHFEPIIFLSTTAPSIFAWEALAREPDTLKAPVELFETADLWGVRFQLQLDMYFLKKAVGIFVTDNSADVGKKNKIRRKHTILPLCVNVHPTSLLRSRYYETIKKLEEQGFMPLNKLYLEISETAPIPLVDNWDGVQHPVDAFRESLYRYRDLDVHFSVDDFGIGFASSSRVSRLGPAFVKIDRDALIDNFGNFTMEYVIKLARRMPGEMGVIIEGYDDESKFSLRRLYELGARYIQGHKYGLTRPEIDDRLPAEIAEEICHALEGLQ